MNMDTKCCGETGRVSSLEYPRWHAGQLVTDRDLSDQLEYVLGVHRLLNRMLHGWGVVCGLRVCRVRGADGEEVPWVVEIQPGLALSPWGEHIIVDRPTRVDLRKHGQKGPTDEPVDPKSDPWCSDVYRCEPSGEIYVCVHYWRAKTRPVRVQPLGCGCDDTQCEYSRWRDSFKVCLLDDCPATHQEPPELETLFRGGIPDCPECPEEDCVVLAKVVLGDEGKIEEIDNCACRRLVASFGTFWWQCRDEKTEREVGIDRPREVRELQPGEARLAIGGRFERVPEDAVIRLEAADGTADVEVTRFDARPRRLELAVKVPDGAKPGPRSLVIRDPDGTVLARRAEMIRVAAADAGKPSTRSTSRRGTRSGTKKGEEDKRS